jgi:hypothetical protein
VHVDIREWHAYVNVSALLDFVSTADHGNVMLCVITTSMANDEETLNRSAYARAVLINPS